MSSSERLSSGEITENDGFSVVAATSVTHPCSTPGSSASCCAFVKRWISSRKSTVRSPMKSRARSASSITARTSFTPAEIADSCTKRRPPEFARACAIVVLPVPGGPQRITEVPAESAPSAAARRCSGEPGRSRCRCPTTSSSARGRILAARGAAPPPPSVGWSIIPTMLARPAPRARRPPEPSRRVAGRARRWPSIVGMPANGPVRPIAPPTSAGSTSNTRNTTCPNSPSTRTAASRPTAPST